MSDLHPPPPPFLSLTHALFHIIFCGRGSPAECNTVVPSLQQIIYEFAGAAKLEGLRRWVELHIEAREFYFADGIKEYRCNSPREKNVAYIVYERENSVSPVTLSFFYIYDRFRFRQ